MIFLVIFLDPVVKPRDDRAKLIHAGNARSSRKYKELEYNVFKYENI
ncbi:MAG TPA: palindromic element RPE4 domain-containing protein [Rickettsia endosymbiont of Columbicola hoogstraali]|nr:palindromic element RPE4 domain-containing protein [Rickettsia endosymbiont of Columbicola hoogstraali]